MNKLEKKWSLYENIDIITLNSLKEDKEVCRTGRADFVRGAVVYHSKLRVKYSTNTKESLLTENLKLFCI